MNPNTIKANQAIIRLEHVLRHDDRPNLRKQMQWGWGGVNWDTAKKHLREKWIELLDIAHQRLTINI
jgi:hypothetical protein